MVNRVHGWVLSIQYFQSVLFSQDYLVSTLQSVLLSVWFSHIISEPREFRFLELPLTVDDYILTRCSKVILGFLKALLSGN